MLSEEADVREGERAPKLGSRVCTIAHDPLPTAFHTMAPPSV